MRGVRVKRLGGNETCTDLKFGGCYKQKNLCSKSNAFVKMWHHRGGFDRGLKVSQVTGMSIVKRSSGSSPSAARNAASLSASGGTLAMGPERGRDLEPVESGIWYVWCIWCSVLGQTDSLGGPNIDSLTD